MRVLHWIGYCCAVRAARRADLKRSPQAELSLTPAPEPVAVFTNGLIVTLAAKQDMNGGAGNMLQDVYDWAAFSSIEENVTGSFLQIHKKLTLIFYNALRTSKLRVQIPAGN
jgi:hypothetical protein